MRTSFLAAAAALAVVSTAAVASVTIDAGGFGFVGKGDVQTAYGWNNAVAQAQQNNVSFFVDSSLSYDVTCEWDTVTGGKNSKTITDTVTNHKNITSTAEVGKTNKVTGQYTGWFLNGYQGTFSAAELPQVGDSCPQGGSASDNDPPANDAVITEVTNIVDNGSNLFAHHTTQGDRLLLTF
jgi:hypothetical protein